MGLVGEPGRRHLHLPKHPHQDVQEMRELGEQRTAVQRHGHHDRRVVRIVPVPKALRELAARVAGPVLFALFIHWAAGAPFCITPKTVTPSASASAFNASTLSVVRPMGFSNTVLASPHRLQRHVRPVGGTPTRPPHRTGQQRLEGLVGHLDHGARRRGRYLPPPRAGRPAAPESSAHGACQCAHTRHRETYRCHAAR